VAATGLLAQAARALLIKVVVEVSELLQLVHIILRHIQLLGVMAVVEDLLEPF
jgi:hypothetical protein